MGVGWQHDGGGPCGTVGAALILLTCLPAPQSAQHRGGHGFHGSGHAFAPAATAFTPAVTAFTARAALSRRGRGLWPLQHRPFGSRLIVVAPSAVRLSTPRPPFAYPRGGRLRAAAGGVAAPPPAYAPRRVLALRPRRGSAAAGVRTPAAQDRRADPAPRPSSRPERYVLRGDGVNVPYHLGVDPIRHGAAPAARRRARWPGATVYAWTDANGVTTWDRSPVEGAAPSIAPNARREPRSPAVAPRRIPMSRRVVVDGDRVDLPGSPRRERRGPAFCTCSTGAQHRKGPGALVAPASTKAGHDRGSPTTAILIRHDPRGLFVGHGRADAGSAMPGAMVVANGATRIDAPSAGRPLADR